MFFTKKRAAVNLTKLYFSCDLATPVHVAFIRELFATCQFAPFRYSVNYGVARDIAVFGGSEFYMTFGDLEDLDVTDINGSTVGGLGRAGKAFSTIGLFECVVVNGDSDLGDGLPALLDRISSRFNPHYGYSRVLRSDYLPATESKLKRGILGSVMVNVGKVEDAWLFDPSGFEAGAIKGVYPVNFWNEKVPARLNSIGFHLPQKRVGETGVVAFNEAECKEISHHNAKYAKYMHFGDC
jgi:hypothetical protein